ncbi:MAG: hypothetical protein Q8O92_12010 [Candidatus Latescibacter sp.]|nr:hypothetical protein [Candidatus Latescibacter sp.]
MIRKRKEFDCIAMKRELQRKYYKETRGMSPEELIVHIRRKVETGPFGELWKKGSAGQHEESVAQEKR